MFVGGVAPQLASYALVHALGERLGQPVGQRLQKDARIVVEVAPKLDMLVRWDRPAGGRVDPGDEIRRGFWTAGGYPRADFRDKLSRHSRVAVWHAVGYYMIIFLAGLQSIPLEVYEAAKVDGANAWHRFRSITLPLLRPTLLFVAVVNTLGSLQVFDLAFVLTNGGPVNATNTVVLYMYQTAFNFTRMGRASAMAVMLFLVILVITLVQLRLLREKE